MAIRRCPYCKAIIEEGAEFCSNCGTQLLFPEDEKIEEEIPGEKNVDDGTDDDDDDEEIAPLEEDKDADPAVEATEPVEKKTEKSVDLQDVKEDQEPVEEIQEKKVESDEFQIEEQKVLTEEKEDESDVEEESSEGETIEEESVEIILESIYEEEVKKEIEKETHPDSKEEVVKMEDVEKTIGSSEFEEQEIDRFIDSMKRDQGEDIASVPSPKEPLQEEPVIEEPIEEELSEEKIVEDSPLLSSTPPIFKKQVIVPPTDDLPAWASKIKEKPPSSIPKEKTPSLDTGMGLPEVVSQKDLPFSGETIEAEEEKTKEPPSQLSTWLKSRVFDVLFIGAVWFITTWIASYVMEVKLFKLISVAALLLLAFYVVLLSAYLFLFFFFLGETLGDYLFNPVHRAGADHLT